MSLPNASHPYTVVTLGADEPLQELLIALLSEADFEGFVQHPDKLEAYLPADSYNEQILHALADQLAAPVLSIREIPAENWNALWEASYPAVSVDDWVQIRPSFQAPQPGFTHSLLINPKMSFGTGHHATTRLMLRQMRNLLFDGRQVLDMGCGTGVLGILAAKLGAAVTFIDVEPWATENTRENLAMNGQTGTVLLGDVEVIPAATQYDVVLANINRNVLLADCTTYQKHLNTGGMLLVSGFFDFDAPLILENLLQLGFTVLHEIAEDGWYSILAKH